MIFIQARMGSTRFPGKTLAKLDNIPLLGHVLHNALQVKSADKVIVLTTTNKLDDEIEDYCNSFKIPTFRGSELNVFERFKDAAIKYKPDTIVRLTADNPFLEAPLIDDAIVCHIKNDVDFTSTRDIFVKKLIRFYPKGFSIDLISSEHLINVDTSKLTDYEKEHIIPYFLSRKDKFKVLFLKSDIKEERGFSIDTYGDLMMAENRLQRIKKKW